MDPLGTPFWEGFLVAEGVGWNPSRTQNQIEPGAQSLKRASYGQHIQKHLAFLTKALQVKHQGALTELGSSEPPLCYGI